MKFGRQNSILVFLYLFGGRFPAYLDHCTFANFSESRLLKYLYFFQFIGM